LEAFNGDPHLIGACGRTGTMNHEGTKIQSPRPPRKTAKTRRGQLHSFIVEVGKEFRFVLKQEAAEDTLASAAYGRLSA
jgi:hypothetical protein